MRITISGPGPSGNVYRADPADMPGSPPNGRGRNKYEAIGSLVVAMAVDAETWCRCGWPRFEIVETEGSDVA